MLLKSLLFAIILSCGCVLNVFADGTLSSQALVKPDILGEEGKAALQAEHALRVQFKQAMEAGDKVKAKELKDQWTVLHQKNMADIKAKREQWVKDHPEEAKKMKEQHIQWLKDHPDAAAKIKAQHQFRKPVQTNSEQ